MMSGLSKGERMIMSESVSVIRKVEIMEEKKGWLLIYCILVV